ncbi:O-acetyl-ADP-ribose deacetylase [Clostridiaceae bacterium HSG29]|nr:O-acetyl-ADP-ribose deacetylase [Clostridiaceae bacterium HSG29]
MNNIEILKDDITKISVDAIVNAANTSLRGGGGVDGAIHKAAGIELLKECQKFGHRKPGEAVITLGYDLPAKHVIHAIGPIWHGGKNNEIAILENAYKNSLRLMIENNIESIAFPNISTGVYRFPKEKAAKIAIDTIKEFLEKYSNKKIIFVCFDNENYKIYKNILNIM